jgi:Uma2 family endonuclease
MASSACYDGAMPVPASVPKWRFTADDYQRMVHARILTKNHRVELIDGEIVAKMTIGPRHSATVDRTAWAFFTKAGESAIVRVQGAVRVNLYSEPEPDIVLLRPRSDFYASGHPGPADILLIVEVAESSIDYDREVKAPVYARSNVHEYWLVDLNEHVLHRYSSPEAGVYRTVRRYGRGQSLALELLPDCVVSTNDLLGG